jgi:hypothetical protein
MSEISFILVKPVIQPGTERVELASGIWAYEVTQVLLVWGSRLVTADFRVRNIDGSESSWDNRIIVERVSVRDTEGLPLVDNFELPLSTIREMGMGQVVRAGPELLPRSVSAETAAAFVHGPRRNLSDDLLSRVAATYREALAAGEPPTRAVERDLAVSHSQAAKYVSRARQRGFLGPTRSGVAGEAGQ